MIILFCLDFFMLFFALKTCRRTIKMRYKKTNVGNVCVCIYESRLIRLTENDINTCKIIIKIERIVSCRVNCSPFFYSSFPFQTTVISTFGLIFFCGKESNANVRKKEQNLQQQTKDSTKIKS
jgi:hypothetical protein